MRNTEYEEENMRNTKSTRNMNKKHEKTARESVSVFSVFFMFSVLLMFSVFMFCVPHFLCVLPRVLCSSCSMCSYVSVLLMFLVFSMFLVLSMFFVFCLLCSLRTWGRQRTQDYEEHTENTKKSYYIFLNMSLQDCDTKNKPDCTNANCGQVILDINCTFLIKPHLPS